MAPMSKSTAHTSTNDHDDGDGGVGNSMNATARRTAPKGSPRTTIRMSSSSESLSSSSIQNQPHLLTAAMNQYALLLPSKKTLCLAVNVNVNNNNNNNNENSSRLRNSTMKDQDPAEKAKQLFTIGNNNAFDDGQTTMTVPKPRSTIDGKSKNVGVGSGGGNAESTSGLNPFGGPSCFDPPPLADCAMDEYHHIHRRVPTSHGLRDDNDGKEVISSAAAAAAAGSGTITDTSSSSKPSQPSTGSSSSPSSDTTMTAAAAAAATTDIMDVDKDVNDGKSSSSSSKDSVQQLETSSSNEPSTSSVVPKTQQQQQHRDPLFESSSFSPSSSPTAIVASSVGRGGSSSNFGGTTCSVKSDDITVKTSSRSVTSADDAKLSSQQQPAPVASSINEGQQCKTENKDSNEDLSVTQPQEPNSSSFSQQEQQQQQQQQQSSIWAAVSSAAAAMMFGEKSTTTTTDATATTTTKSETSTSLSPPLHSSSTAPASTMASAPQLPPTTIAAPLTPKDQEPKQQHDQSQPLPPQYTQQQQQQQQQKLQQSPIDPSGHRRRSSRRSSSEYASSSPAGVARRRARDNNDADGNSLSSQNRPQMSSSNDSFGMVGGAKMKIDVAATTSVTRVRYDMELVPPVVKGSPEFWQSIHTWPPKQNSPQQQSSSRSSSSEFVRPLEDSVLWIPPTRKEWEDCSSELLAVCTSAAWRQRQKKILEMTQQQEKQQTQQKQSDDDEQQQQAAAATLPPFLPPLSKDYIHDRLQIDDPLRGYQIRHAQGGWLQGFLLWTNFTTWVHHLEFNSTVDESGIPAQIKQVRREQRQASSMGVKSTTTTTTIDTTNKLASALQSVKRHGSPDEGGIVLEGVAEIALVGGLGGGAGEMLLRLALEHIRNSRYTSPEDGSQKHYRYILLQATSSSKPFYERYGFKRVGAVCRYGSSQPRPGGGGGGSSTKITSSPDPTLAKPSSFGPIQGYRHWTHAHETQASLDLHGGPSYMMCLELPDHDDPRFLAPASNLGHVMQYYCGTITKPLVQSLGASTTPPARHRRLSSSSSYAKGKKPPLAPSLQSGTSNDGEPPKRKRGRPRKKRTSFAHATNAAPDGDQQFHPTGLPPLAQTPVSSSKSSSKRRKLSEDGNYTDSSVLAELAYNGSAMDVDVDGEPGAMGSNKRGRGRPRRDSDAEGRSRSSSQDDSLPAGTQAGESLESTDMPSDSDKAKKSKQRPPGRARRDPILLDQQAYDESPKESTASKSNFFAVETFPRKPRSAALVASHLISEAKNIESAMWKGQENSDTKKSSSTPLPSKRPKNDRSKSPKPSSSTKARKSPSTSDHGNSKTPPPSSSSTLSNRIMSAADYLDDCRIRKKSMTSSFPIEPKKLCKQQGLSHQRPQQSGENKPVWYNKIIRNKKNAPDELYFVLDYYFKSDSATIVPIAPTGNFARTRNERPRYQCQLLDTNDNWTTVRNISSNSQWETVSPVQAVMKTSMVAQEAWDILPGAL